MTITIDLGDTIDITVGPVCPCECCPRTDCPRRASPAPSTYFDYAARWNPDPFVTYIVPEPVYWPQEFGTAWPT